MQQNQALAEQLQGMKEQANIMSLEITQLNQKCLENKLVLGEHQCKLF
jgi:hypothetical protein